MKLQKISYSYIKKPIIIELTQAIRFLLKKKDLIRY